MKTQILAFALLVLGLSAFRVHAQEGFPILRQTISASGWPSSKRTVAVRGDWMAISIGGSFPSTAGPGRIEIWKRNLGQWSLHSTLIGPTWTEGDPWGICGATMKFDSTATLLIAGDPRFAVAETSPCGDSGECMMACAERVRIFRRNGDTWTLDPGGLLTSQLPASQCKRFGVSVDIEGDIAIVGSPYYGTPGPGLNGAIEFFTRRAGGWEPAGVLRTTSNGGSISTGCGGVNVWVGRSVLFTRPPIPARWYATGNCSVAFNQWQIHGTISALGTPVYTDNTYYTAGGWLAPALLAQDGPRIIGNDLEAERLRITQTGPQGEPVSSAVLAAPAGVGTSLLWGVHTSADSGRLVTLTVDNRIWIYEWNQSAGQNGGYDLVGGMSGPQLDPVSPSIPLGQLETENGKVCVSGNTLAVVALSGSVHIYEFFADCDGNGQPDLDEIAADPLLDCDDTGSLDECEPLPVPPPVPTRSTWKAPFGGSFQDVANWCRQAPVNTTAIEFGIPFNYGITLSQTREVKNITVSNGFPTLNFNPGNLTLRSSTAQAVPQGERYLRVGTQVGTPASLGVLNGTVNTAFGEIGAGPGTQGTLLVGQGGKVVSGTELCVGCEGNGTLLLQSGGQAISQKAVIGKSAGSNGLATVESEFVAFPSQWTATLGIDVKNGTLAVNENGTIIANPIGVILYSGGNLTGSGTVVGPVTNFGSAAGNCGIEGFAFGAPIVHQSGGLAPGGRLPVGGQTYGDYSTIGTLTINGEYRQIAANPELGTNSGSLLVEIAKEGEEIKHDRIAVNGPATLGGGLFVTLATDPAKEQIDFTGLPVFTATAIDPARPNFDIAFMPALPNGRFVKVDATSSLQGGGGAITISTSDLASLLGFGGSSNTTFDLEPLAAAVGDFDGANGNDVAVTLKGVGTSGPAANGSLLVLFNDGEGGLDKVVQMPNQLGRDPVGIVAAPLRAGRKVPDLALVNQGSNTLQVLHNDGIGNFTTGHVVPTGAGSAPSSIDAVPVFAEDPALAGIFDLVITSIGGSSVIVYFNPGDGAPTPLLVLPAGTAPRAVRGVDIDNNRIFDLIAANQQDGLVSVFMRQEPSEKNPGVSFSDALNIAVGDDPVDLVTGDLDGDGRTDITTVNRLSNSVSVLLNRTTTTGEATFAPAVTLPTGGEPQSVVLGDFDQDTATGEPADLDLALTARATTEPDAPRVIKVLRNDRANGVLALAPADDIVVPGAPKLIVADEFDPVTGADIVSLSLGGAQSFNGGEPAATASLVPSTVKPRCAQGDLNCDGSVDANDLAIVLAAWGTNDPAADIDGSGVVDASDLSFILANWGGGAQ